MKSGAGDDPFADDPFEEDEGEANDEPNEEDDESEPESTPSTATDGETDPAAGDRTDTDTETEARSDRQGAGGDDRTADTEREAAASEAGRSGEREASDSASATTGDRTDSAPGDDDQSGTDTEAQDIPWVLRRSRVKEDRDNVHQFFLRDEYSKAEDDIIAAVADELDVREKQLKKLDVREAMVATADAEAIAETLSEWGYEYVD